MPVAGSSNGHSFIIKNNLYLITGKYMTYTSSILLRSALFIFACVLHTAAHAEAKVGDRFGDWIFECRAVTAGKNVCALTQTIVTKKDSRRILSLSMGNNEEKKEAELVAVLQLGIYLPSGVTGSVGQEKSFPLIVQRCIQQGCIATAKVDSALLKSLQSGEKLAITFSMQPSAKPIVIEASLKGLTEGMKAINLK